MAWCGKEVCLEEVCALLGSIVVTSSIFKTALLDYGSVVLQRAGRLRPTWLPAVWLA